MYCKFCGNRIASNATKCVSCGASINLNDGGQSFFDDDELYEWQADSIIDGQHTSIPKTEMRKPINDNDSDFKVKNYKKVSATQKDSNDDRSVYYPSTARRRTKKKTVSDHFNLSSSNRLIILCIASALSIVLPTVSIIAVFNSGNDSNKEMYAATQSAEEAKRAQTAAELPEAGDKNDVSEPETSSDVKEEISKIEIKDVEIIISGKKVEHPVSAYMIDNKLYVSLGRILKNEGYKEGKKPYYDEKRENRIRYDHSEDSRCIEIEPGTNTIWIKNADGKAKGQSMDENSFVEGTEIYVPVRSFLNKIGYSKIEYDRDKKILTVNK